MTLVDPSTLLADAVSTYKSRRPQQVAHGKRRKVAPDTVTENGAPSFSTTGSARLDMFFGGLVRGASEEKLRDMLKASWAESPEHTVQLVKHARDCRKGKGEKAVVLHCLLWLREHKTSTYILNLENFLELGYFKDLLNLATRAMAAGLPRLGFKDMIELEFFAKFLERDVNSLQSLTQGANGSSDAELAPRLSISLAAKWAPSEGRHHDKQGHHANRMARLLFGDSKVAMQRYRKEVLQPLRAHLTIVESLMCADRWDEIHFSAVPSKAHKNLGKAFSRHQRERYSQYMADLKSGKTKINTTGLHPHELVRGYLSGATEDETTEAQWSALLSKLKAAGQFDSALAIVDVSGSMSGVPMEVAITLGLIVAEMTREPYHGKLITFDAEPTWHTVCGHSLAEQVRDVSAMPWGMTTNLLKVFTMILGVAWDAGVPAKDMPKTLFIFSDMQFGDAAAGDDYRTTYMQAAEMYSTAGYEVPAVVFWNLRGDTLDFPATSDTPGVSMVSGFSADLLKLFLDGGRIDPMAVMEKALAPYSAVIDEDDR